jgi:large subunit ribosomal protein L29
MGENKKMNQEDIRQFVTADLETKIKNDRLELDRLVYTHAVSTSGNPASIRVKRRDIARLLTELAKRKQENKA